MDVIAARILRPTFPTSLRLQDRAGLAVDVRPRVDGLEVRDGEPSEVDATVRGDVLPKTDVGSQGEACVHVPHDGARLLTILLPLGLGALYRAVGEGAALAVTRDLRAVPGVVTA